MSPPGINLTKEQAVEKLRIFLGDSKSENKLIPGEELSNDKLSLALDLALDEFNNTPPFMSFTLATFPSLSVILQGAAVHSLMMAGFIQTRNYLQFSDGGISEVINDKSPMYQGWINMIMNSVIGYAKNASDIKIALNMASGFGVVKSPYGYGYDDDWCG